MTRPCSLVRIVMLDCVSSQHSCLMFWSSCGECIIDNHKHTWTACAGLMIDVSKGDRTAMKANHTSNHRLSCQASYTLLYINTEMCWPDVWGVSSFCYMVHMLNKERLKWDLINILIDSKLRCFSLNSFWMTTSDLFASVKTSETKIPEWNITEPFIKSSELLKIKLQITHFSSGFRYTCKSHL